MVQSNKQEEDIQWQQGGTVPILLSSHHPTCPLSSPLSLCLVLPSEPSAASPCLTDSLIHCVADEMVVCLLDAKVVCELLFIGVYSERLR